jgi:hypothetical protein
VNNDELREMVEDDPSQTNQELKNKTTRQLQVCNVKYMFDRVNRRDGYSMKNAVSFVR